ncbi:hypothetical protein GEV33_000942 [Tenebrio molitor]|uniref:Uncharacterized protein n=1 Tax=Tenebrio molitor TaxID=7067 RepID=A0A8J6HVZ8_TENMO|nr:hypothetical protein GEV33_000942 [Tenebrio molitor]
MSGTPNQMFDLKTIKTALKKLNYPIPAELTNMLRDQMIDIQTFETLWTRLSPPTVEEVCSLPTFAGLDHEDPKKFITECKNILANSNPALWRDQIAAQFRLEPARWWRYEAPDGHHLLEEPRHAANNVVPPAPFVGEPATRHHERLHQPRDQQPVEHQTLDEPRFNEEDAPQDTTTGDAAGVPPQEAGGPRQAQDVHRDRCIHLLLEREGGEATTAAVRPEDVPTELIDQKRDGPPSATTTPTRSSPRTSPRAS